MQLLQTQKVILGRCWFARCVALSSPVVRVLRSPLLLAMLLLAIVGATAHAQTKTWMIQVAGNWEDPFKWTPPGQPMSSNDAVINSGVAQITTAGRTARDVYVGANGGLQILGDGNLNSRAAIIAEPTIGSGASVSVLAANWTMVGSLTVGARGRGTLVISAAGSVANFSAQLGTAIGSEGAVSVNGAGSTWTNDGILTIGSFGAGTLTISNGGSVSSNQAFVGSNSESSGVVTVNGAGASWMNDGLGSFAVGTSGTGRLTVSDGGGVFSGSSTIGRDSRSSGAVRVEGSTSSWNCHDLSIGEHGTGNLVISHGGSVSSHVGSIGRNSGAVGTVTVTDAGSTWTASGRLFLGGLPIRNGGTGTLYIQGGARVALSEDILLFPDGLVRLAGGTLATSAVGFQGGGQFQWVSGRLHVDLFAGDLTNPSAGWLAPGRPLPTTSNGVAGSTTILGDYTQRAGATLEIEIGGPLVNTQHDFVNVAGTALLGGELQLDLINGFLPNPQQTFTIVNAGSLLGFFSNVTDGQRLTTSDGGGSFRVHYGPTSTFSPNQIVLTDFQLACLPGDYNCNGTVDAADYVHWRMYDGTQQGYNIWRTNFGRTISAGSGSSLPSAEPLSAAVPEPSTLIIMTLAAVSWCLHQRHAAL